MFYMCKFHDKTEHATRSTKCWLIFSKSATLKQITDDFFFKCLL